jgi:hypothetical protein
MAVLQSFNRGIRDLKIATWDGANDWGTAYDILGARVANLSWTIESDELRGDDVVLDRFTKVVAATVSIAMASVDLIVADMIMGGTLLSNSDYYDLKIGEADEVPFVGLAGRVVGSGGAGDLHFLIPKAKLSGNFNFNASVDTYMIPAADFQGVHEGTENGMLRLRHFFLPTALEIPLRTSSGGL